MGRKGGEYADLNVRKPDKHENKKSLPKIVLWRILSNTKRTPKHFQNMGKRHKILTFLLHSV